MIHLFTIKTPKPQEVRSLWIESNYKIKLILLYLLNIINIIFKMSDTVGIIQKKIAFELNIKNAYVDFPDGTLMTIYWV